jgi:hypothetical protein
MAVDGGNSRDLADCPPLVALAGEGVSKSVSQSGGNGVRGASQARLHVEKTGGGKRG